MTYEEKEEYSKVLASMIRDLGFSCQVEKFTESNFELVITSLEVSKLYEFIFEQDLENKSVWGGDSFRVSFNDRDHGISFKLSHSHRLLSIIPYTDWRKDDWRDLRIFVEHVRIHFDAKISQLSKLVKNDRDC